MNANRGELRIHRLFEASAAGPAARPLSLIQEGSSLGTICPACAQGPSRVEGHPGLRVLAMGPFHMTFTCLYCESVWSRNYVRSTTYAWELLAIAESGVFMPGVVPQALMRRREAE